jgi:hypothetical protein
VASGDEAFNQRQVVRGEKIEHWSVSLADDQNITASGKCVNRKITRDGKYV